MNLSLRILLFLTLYGSAFSESYFDLSMFKNGNQPYLNISYHADYDDVKYQKINNKFIAKLDLQIIVNDLKSNKIDTLIWKYTSQLDSTQNANKSVIIAENRLNLLNNTNYQIECNAYFENRKLASNSLHLNTELHSKPFISDILLAHNIQEATNSNSSEFIHYNFKVTPNASNSIYGTEPILLSYQEIYNLSSYIGQTIYFKYAIIDGTRKEVLSQTKKLIVKFADFNDVFDLALFDLSTGTYYLNISINDSLNNHICTQSKLFYLMNPLSKPKIDGLFRESRAFEESVFSSMTDAEIDNEFNKFKLILTEYEIDQFEKLIDYKAKRRAIYKYWHIRDTDTSTVINEKREDFLKRISFAEKMFGNGLENSGWRTDRGKVVLKYGIPPIRNINLREGDRVECEEWFYDDLAGGLYFYFVQRFSLTNLILVHSNAIGEPKDLNWVQNYNPNIRVDGSSQFQDRNNRQR